MTKFYLHILNKNGNQRVVTTDSTRKKELLQLLAEGWVLQDTKEFTDINEAVKTKALIMNVMEDSGRMQNVF